MLIKWRWCTVKEQEVCDATFYSCFRVRIASSGACRVGHRDGEAFRSRRCGRRHQDHDRRNGAMAWPGYTTDAPHLPADRRYEDHAGRATKDGAGGWKWAFN